MTSDKVRIGYWNCRGFVGHIRLILEYAGVNYEFYVPPHGPAPHFKIDPWLKEKYQYLEGFDFPNLPFYKDDKVKLTQHVSILEYLGRKHFLWPNTEDELNECSMLREVAHDIVWKVIDYIYFYDHRAKGTEPTVEEKKVKRTAFIDSMKPLLKDLSKLYKKNGDHWMLGEKLTYIDFLMYEHLDFSKMLVPNLYDETPNLDSFLAKFEQLPRVKDYHSSDGYRKYPIFGERSFIGRSKEDWQDHV